MVIKNYFFLLFLCLFLCHCRETVAPPSPKSIINFSFEGISTAQVQIQEEKHLIEITVPFGTKLTALKPMIGLSAATTIVPASGQVRDFSQPQYYTLTGADGSKVIYQIKVLVGAEPLAEILSLSQDTVELGQSLILKVKNLSRFPSEVQTDLLHNGKLTRAVSKLMDSVSVQVSIPAEALPETYTIQLTNKGKIALSKPLVVQYASPVPQSIHKNVLQGDTLWVRGRFFNPAQNFQVILNQAQVKTTISALKSMTDSLAFVLPPNQKTGTYTLIVRNVTENKTSKEAVEIEVYDAQKPFVRNLINPKSIYKASDVLVWKVQNFDKVSARFYQVQLQSSNQLYAINAQYDAVKKQMTITLPANIKTGTYKTALLFTNATGETLYEIELNDTIKI